VGVGRPTCLVEEHRLCRSCGRRLFGRGDVCRSRKCPEYSRVWAGDQRQKLFVNLAAYGAEIVMSAVTAPGSDVLPWDERVCAGLGEHRHSGLLGCKVNQAAADDWNRDAADRWRRLHRRAYQSTVKLTGPRSVRLLARVWELQTRGVLHVHPVLGYGTAAEMAGARAYLEQLAELAPKYGFGFVDHGRRKVKPQPATGAAAYLSSYFVKGSGGKAALWESVTSRAMPRSIIYVSVALTQETHCTMRLLRLAGRCTCCGVAGCRWPRCGLWRVSSTRSAGTSSCCRSLMPIAGRRRTVSTVGRRKVVRRMSSVEQVPGDHGLDGWVVDWVCQDCGQQTTTAAAWDRRPICCDWEMVGLFGTVRPAGTGVR
jgi:hypothetical protein